MHPIPLALLRALRSQFHPSMLLLTLLPLAIALLIWGGVLWTGWEAAVNAIQRFLSGSSLAAWVHAAAAHIGLDRVSWHWEVFAAPVLFALFLVPAIVLSVVVIIGLIGAPLAVRHVARAYPGLEARRGGGWLASMANALAASAVFVLAWILTLPLWLVPPLGVVVPMVLWGWLNYRVMSFDALAEHADALERARIMKERRLGLWTLGIMAAGLGVVPTLIWVAGAFVLVFLGPLFAIVTLWLYVVVFTYSALAFAHFGLDALVRLRGGSSMEG